MLTACVNHLDASDDCVIVYVIVSVIGRGEAKFSLSKLLKPLHNRINCSNFVER